jgi:hypothetical protein
MAQRAKPGFGTIAWGAFHPVPAMGAGGHPTHNLLQRRRKFGPCRGGRYPGAATLPLGVPCQFVTLCVLSRPRGDKSRHRRSAPVEESCPPSVRAWTRQFTSFPATDEVSARAGIPPFRKSMQELRYDDRNR